MTTFASSSRFDSRSTRCLMVDYWYPSYGSRDFALRDDHPYPADAKDTTTPMFTIVGSFAYAAMGGPWFRIAHRRQRARGP